MVLMERALSCCPPCCGCASFRLGCGAPDEKLCFKRKNTHKALAHVYTQVHTQTHTQIYTHRCGLSHTDAHNMNKMQTDNAHTQMQTHTFTFSTTLSLSLSLSFP